MNGKNEFDTMMSYLIIMVVINCIAAFFLSIVLTGMEIANLCGADLPCIEGEKLEEA